VTFHGLDMCRTMCPCISHARPANGASHNMWYIPHSTPMWMQAATTLIKQLVLSAEAVEYCKNKVERVRGRVGALAPALSLLHDTLSSQATAEAVEERALQSLNDTLLCLFKVHAPHCSPHTRVDYCIINAYLHLICITTNSHL
jgi:hypothetical protein